MQYLCWIPARGQTRDDAYLHAAGSPERAAEAHAEAVWSSADPFHEIEVAVLFADAVSLAAPELYEVEAVPVPLFRATKAPPARR